MSHFSFLSSLPIIRSGLFSLLLLGGFSRGYGQTTYYVAAAGSDANSGRSAADPFQSLAKVSSLSLQPGDAVLLRRGDTFRGTLFIRQSGSGNQPIVVDAYGSGNKPVIAGSVPVGGWANIGNNTWQASCPSCGNEVTGLYRNAATLPLGRYPNLSDANKGYLTVQSHNGNSQLTSQQGLPTNFTGGEVVARATMWIMNRATITGQNGNTLFLSSNSSYNLADNWGFFVQNHPATLDQPGEWCYDPGNKTIRLYDPQNDPNGQFITATAFGEGVNLTFSSNITVRNLQITQTLTTGVLANGGSNLTLSGNDITSSGTDGVLILGSGSNVLAENNLIEDANNNGFYIHPYQNFTFRGNTLRRIGVVPGRGRSGDGSYSGVQSLCNNNTLIENNILDQIGYTGISVFANSTVQKNQVANFCQTKSDGGGIYSWNGNRASSGGLRILSNLVWNGIGTPEGSPGVSHSGANGIFMDDCTHNSEVANNTVFDTRGLGIFLRGAYDINLHDNTSYNNTEEQLMLAYNNSCDLRNNAIQGNILFSRLPSQPVVAYESNANDLNQFGPFDRNYYVRPFEDLFKIQAIFNPGGGLTGGRYTLAEWQSRWGQDRNSFNSPLTYKTQVVTQGGNSLLNQSFSENINGWSGYSPYGNGRVDWDNTNRLDGGSMRLSFASPSNRGDSYLLTYINLGSISKGKTYQLLFDGVASGNGKRVEIYPRQLSGSYRDLGARSAFVLGTGRQPYEVTFEATDNESNAILIVQVYEDGQTAWLDNIKLQEATLTTVNPDDYIKFKYNPTFQSRTEALDGVYRDAKNNVYDRQVTLAPFTSVVLMKETNATTPPPPPPTALRDPENPANATAGLDYQYYEGSWSTLPDFNTVTPVKQGTVATPDLSVRNRTEQYGVQYRGFVNVPTDGTYTFYTNSDDGSKLFIGSTEVVNNDGGHATQERSGTIGLKAGKHAITVIYFQGAGGQDLSVSYAGPNIGKQVLPAASFFRVSTGTTPPPPPPTAALRDPENPANATAGLDYQYYEGSWSVLPDFNTVTPVKQGTIATPDLSVRNRTEQYGVQYRGFVNVPTDGTYTFYTNSDDGSKLFIGSTEVVNNDGGHATQERSGTIGLKAGKHAITVIYFQGAGGQDLSVSYAGPNIGKQVLPAASFFRVSTGTTPPPPPPTAGNAIYLSDLNWTSATSGYGPVERDRSNGDLGANDGRTITLNGVTYAKGLGAHAPSEIVYNLGGSYTTFLTDIGIDDEMEGGCGSAEFEVYLDNVLVYSSGVMTNSTPTKSVNLNVSGKQTLRLVIKPGADYCGDHGDWAGARLVPAGTTPPPPPPTAGNAIYLSDLNWTSATSGYGPVERDRSNGDLGANDGRTITLNGVTYAKGLGAHAPSEIVYNLGGSYTTFLTDIGIDDEMEGACGSAEFEVYVDNVLVYSSGVMTNSTPTKSINLNVSGKQTLRLVIKPGADYCGDHGDWAGARLVPAGSARMAALSEEETGTAVQVFPVPARETVWVRYYATTAGEVTVQFINAAALPVLREAHPVVVGENLIRVPVRDLNRGLYIMTLIQDHRRVTRKVLLTE